MQKRCDSKCTGMLIRDRRGRLLLIERKKHNPGFACPAGHNDGDTPEDTARKESGEEVGLQLDELLCVWTGRLDNPCLGRSGAYHDWTVFEATKWSGKVKTGEGEVKSYVWADHAQLRECAARLERFMAENGFSFDRLSELVCATNESQSWKQNPGLEPPWYLILKILKVI